VPVSILVEDLSGQLDLDVEYDVSWEPGDDPVVNVRHVSYTQIVHGKLVERDLTWLSHDGAINEALEDYIRAEELQHAEDLGESLLEAQADWLREEARDAQADWLREEARA
jgi:hypothetical protein